MLIMITIQFPEITIVTPDQIGNFNDNNIAPPGNDHILTISYSGVIAPITIDISGTNDTPELDHADSNGDIIEDDHSHQHHNGAETIKAIRMTGVYEENDVIRTLINNHAIVYTIEAEDISQYGDGTGGAGTEAQIQINVAQKLADTINDFNIYNQGLLGNIHAEAVNGVVGVLAFDENQPITSYKRDDKQRKRQHTRRFRRTSIGRRLHA